MVTYGKEVKPAGDLGAAADASSAVSGLQAAEVLDPKLIDAIRKGVAMVGNAETKRKLVVVFSDSINVNMDQPRLFADVGKRAAEAGVIIHAIGFNVSQPERLPYLRSVAEKALGSFRVAKSPGDIAEQFSGLIDDLKKQYVVTFAPPMPGGEEIGRAHV